MRKFLFVLLIVMFFLVWYDIPAIEGVKTYTEIQDAYIDYQSVLDTLKQKNDIELPEIQRKLDKEYTESDTDNVIKIYNENKKYYEDLVALQRANASVGSADIYDIEKIWTNIGKYAKQNDLKFDIEPVESESDLGSQDYIMCNLNIKVTGKYINIAEFIDSIELDTEMAFQINDFFMEGYEKTARNQSKDSNMDTNNIPSGATSSDESVEGDGSSYESYDSSTTYSSSSEQDPHALDVVAYFSIYNVPLNRKNVTNIKTLTPENAEEEDTTSETYGDAGVTEVTTTDETATDETTTDETTTDGTETSE